MRAIRVWAAACTISLAALGSAGAQPSPAPQMEGGTSFTPHSGQPGKDVIWIPSPQALVDRMLDMAGATRRTTSSTLGPATGER